LPEDGERFDRTVDSHVSRIRKKLGPIAGGRIRTVWGIGYRCDEGSE
ncbi:MAG: winged helix-turn-helix domain-containing protein, partial [Myxococcota bacterium]